MINHKFVFFSAVQIYDLSYIHLHSTFLFSLSAFPTNQVLLLEFIYAIPRTVAHPMAATPNATVSLEVLSLADPRGVSTDNLCSFSFSSIDFLTVTMKARTRDIPCHPIEVRHFPSVPIHKN